MTALTLDGVFSVPPLPRRADARRTLDLDAAEQIARYIEAGGITRFLYGGNAFLYHATLGEFEMLCGWLASFAAPRWPIPSIGPSFGHAMDQARILRRHRFPAVMMLPCGDPRDAGGLDAGYRDIADAAGMPLILYLKSDTVFGSDRDAGLDAIGRLVADGVAVAIKYAVVLDDPSRDPYLDGLLRRVDRSKVVSGMGERPAVVHLRDFGLIGMTTGSGCIAPARCQEFFAAARAGDWAAAETLRAHFIPLEDLRDAWGPARVLHHATEAAGIAGTGPIPPYVSALKDAQIAQVTPAARTLRDA
ncbi:MAG TPA: dihydrodipicolinate synthase family protein [Vicinamibacterales bacterium]|jgi:dihydrodipicolinate synthase/N-acetylneuraminate lyase